MDIKEVARDLRNRASQIMNAATILDNVSTTNGVTAKHATKGFRRMSAAGRKRIALAQKKRWALHRGGKAA